jgi:DNA-directed RNA polymerase specialized sigma24 family protein
VGRDEDFERFFREVEPRLRRAFVGTHGVEAARDAAAEAMAWAWEFWERVQTMDAPAGYLFRVGQSKARRRKVPSLPAVESLNLPDVEPRLIPALRGLPARQRTAVWLVHACQWRQAEVAEAMGVSASAVGTHVSRGLERLRATFEVTDHA